MIMTETKTETKNGSLPKWLQIILGVTGPLSALFLAWLVSLSLQLKENDAVMNTKQESILEHLRTIELWQIDHGKQKGHPGMVIEIDNLKKQVDGLHDKNK